MFDALFFVSFGGPEGPDDVMPFLENVLRGKNVTEERKKEVAQHYMRFDGVSPINAQNRALIQKLKVAFDKHDILMPIYWGNRNWHPTIEEAVSKMRADGVTHALSYFTSHFSTYSGCRQYREHIEKAQAQVGEGAPQISKLRMGFNHPFFVDAVANGLEKTRQDVQSQGFTKPKVFFTAHSIPLSMSQGSDYVKQLKEASRLVSQNLGVDDWDLVYQSRSGPPQMPWLEPDVCDAIGDINVDKHDAVILCPIGFTTDHMEVMYDLDIEAKAKAKALGLGFGRAHAPGHDDRLIDMIVDLVKERQGTQPDKKALGPMGPWHDVCPPDCCTYAPRRPKGV